MNEIRETISLVLSGLIVTGITTLIVLGKRIVGLPKEMIIVKAAVFRLLRSNKLQGTALARMAECQKEGTQNGKTEEAVRAVTIDQERTETFFLKAALGKTDVLDDVIKEDEP